MPYMMRRNEILRFAQDGMQLFFGRPRFYLKLQVHVLTPARNDGRIHLDASHVARSKPGSVPSPSGSGTWSGCMSASSSGGPRPARMRVCCSWWSRSEGRRHPQGARLPEAARAPEI